MPQKPGFVDYPSTRGIQVEVGLPDATLENRAESPLYGELYPNTILVLNLKISSIEQIIISSPMAYKHNLIPYNCVILLTH